MAVNDRPGAAHGANWRSSGRADTAENGTVYDVAGSDPVGQAAGFSKL
jgi:hypothetical protein